MDFISLFSEHSSISILSLAVFSCLAGFVDAAVGGGGLIQLPAVLVALPNTPITTLFGTNKIASLAGTSMSALEYAKRIRFNPAILIVVALCAGITSYAGAQIIGLIPVDLLKRIILFVLVAIAAYTFLKKDLGSAQTKELASGKLYLLGGLIGLVVGFYDGLFGPGTGSFFVLGFVMILGFDFLTASAYAKVVNCMTNISALAVFVRQGSYLPEIAFLMSLCNIIGSLIGARMALKHGNSFIRVVFQVVVICLILRFGYDICIQE
ncbi:MAG: sulfite exporter TauE/SafE family protein [Bacteroidota bacterium]